jgi:polysaccharide biosynthesis transport protein
MHDEPGPRGGLALAALRHHVGLLLVLGCVGLAAGAAVGEVRPATYTATASVLVNPVEGSSYAPQDEEDSLTSLETEAQIVRSDAVTRLALARLPGRATLGELRDGVGVVVPENTQIMQISSRAPGPLAARDRAQAYALAYLDYRRQRAQDAVDAQLAGIEQQTAEVTADLQDATAAAAEAAAAGDTADEAFQEQLAQALNDELVELRAGRVALQSAVAIPGRLLSSAQAPAGPAGLGGLTFMLAGLVAGLLGGVALALGRQHRDDRVYTPADVERAGLPVLAAMPRRPHRYADQSTPEEVVRRLRSAVMTTAPWPPVVLVSGCTPGVAEPGVAARLSLSLGKAWSNVILVDAGDGVLDPGGTLPNVRAPGVSEVLLGEAADPRDLLVPMRRRLRVLPRGERPEETADRALPKQVDALLRPLVADADYVVLRAPSVRLTAGAAMAAACGGTLLVVVRGVTTRVDVVAAVAAVEATERPLLGAVLAPSASRSRRRRAKAQAPAPERARAGQGGEGAARGGRASWPSPT